MARRCAWGLFFVVASLTASAAAVQAQPVTIVWDASTEAGAVGYRVYVGTTSSMYSEVFDAGNLTRLTYPSGVAGRRYYFAVSTYDARRIEGPRSFEVSTVVGGSSGEPPGGGGPGGPSPTPPTPTDDDPPPTGPGPATPAVLLQPAVIRGGMVTLSWSPVGGLTASEYLLEAGSATGLSNLYNGSVGAVTSLSAQVGPGNYFVRVRGRASSGATTNPSNEVSFAVGTAGCTAPPAVPTAVVGSSAAGRAGLTWLAAVGATSYIVQAGSAPGVSDIFYGDVGGGTSISAAVPPGFTAYVRVVAVNGCGQSAASTEIFLQ
jgi:hypothetical protein